MTKEEVAKKASFEGSEEGPLGAWSCARLAQRPQAGAVVQVDGNWYVAVAGRRHEGYRGDYGGLYARWVQVPADECKDW
jgi:hypothetical protein